jgi:SEC-C motif domain protein
MKKPNLTTNRCPCGGPSYAACCKPYHSGIPAPDAEALMRSRYCAYVLQLEPYLIATWHREHRSAALALEQDKTQWMGLDVKRHVVESPDAALVEFVARYKLNGRAHRLHEISRFVREEGQWFYLDGTFPE